jgi:AraC-like DNA-binding protein
METGKAQHKVTVWQFQDIVLEHYLYAPGPPEVLAKHAHADYQIGLSLNFPGAYEYRGSTHLVPAGSVSILHPGEMHAARDLDFRQNRAEFRMMYISPDLLQRTTADVAGHSVSQPFFPTPVIRDPRVVTLFLTAHQALATATTLQLERDSFLLELLKSLTRRYTQDPPVPGAFPTARPEVIRARDYLHDNATRNISLQELANVAGLSPFHLARVFRQEIGLPPHLYQVQVRIAQAKHLLARGWRVAQVATETGFYDQSHFGGHFKRLVGVTPARYVGKSKNFLDLAG